MTSGAGAQPPGLAINNDILRFDRCRHGSFLSLRSDQYIGRSLAEYGEWGEGEITFLSQLLRPGDVVIDAGANVGTHSVAFARKVGPRGRVYAFEPQPVIHQILSANVVINGLSQVITLNSGLSDRQGSIEFPELNYGARANFGGFSLEKIGKLADRSTAPRRVKIATAPLDEVLTLDSLRLIKADVEGMEAAMLRGAHATLKRLRPALYLECNTPDEVTGILAALDGLDYNAYWHVTPVFNRENWRGATQDVFDNIANLNMLCVPSAVEVKGLPVASGPGDHPKTTSARRKPASKERSQ